MNLRLSKCVTLMVDVTDEMISDYKECKTLSEIRGGDGKDCKSCLLDLEGYDIGLCEMDMVTAELERRIQDAAGNGVK